MSTFDTLLVLLACVLLVALELLFVMAIFAPQAVVRAVRRLARPLTRTPPPWAAPRPRTLSGVPRRGRSPSAVPPGRQLRNGGEHVARQPRAVARPFGRGANTDHDVVARSGAH